MLYVENLDVKTEIDGHWYVARPFIGPLICRIRDAWEVIIGRADAIKFYKQ